MPNVVRGEDRPGLLVRFIRRLNWLVLHWGGPAQLGRANPGDAEPRDVPGVAICSSCGEPMPLHRIDRSGARTRLYHPEPSGR